MTKRPTTGPDTDGRLRAIRANVARLERLVEQLRAEVAMAAERLRQLADEDGAESEDADFPP